MFKAEQIRQKYLNFFGQKNHKIIPPDFLVQKDDVSTSLFTVAGMQQLNAYLKGKKHPMGNRLTNVQPCLRLEDINEVGDNHHTTFFEMLGNWSLGDYSKKDQLNWIFQFITQELNLDPNKLYVSVFAGDKNIPADKESFRIWQEIFNTQQNFPVPNQVFDPAIKIYSYQSDKNWWSRSGKPENMPTGEIGGPDSEIFYDFGPELKFHQNSLDKNKPCHINCSCGRFLEIGNSVFIEYQKEKDGSFSKLPQKNVDFGGGLERILAATEHQPDIFQTSLLSPLVKIIERETELKYSEHQTNMRIIVDHLRASTFLISEGLEPSNKQQGYILRRLLRRAIIKLNRLSPQIDPVSIFEKLAEQIISTYKQYFSDQHLNKKVNTVIKTETVKFKKTLNKGLKEFKKLPPEELNAQSAFNLYQSFGFPVEITQELFQQEGRPFKIEEFNQIRQKHQKLSRTSSVGMFKGGLTDHQEETVKLHTATHLLHQALRQTLGEDVSQSGSNITSERARFDFNYPRPLKKNEIKKIENIVNEQISKKLPVTSRTSTYQKAIKEGALAFFKHKYPDKVSVYSVGDFSSEVCRGPHVSNSGEIGNIKIYKQKTLGQGIRRLYFKRV